MSCLKNYPSPISPIKVHEESDSLLVVSNLFKKFSEKEDSRGLKELNFTIEAGQVTAIIGESGSGKSTLLKLIYGLIKVDEGEIVFRGERVKGPHEKLIPGHDSMRMVSQHFDDLNTYANVWDNVASRLSNTDLAKKEHQTQKALERLKISQLKGQRIADLSGGEKQRVAIARALITEPEILLMDEPFNQIDSAFRDQLQSDMRQIVNETGLTVILVSHDPGEVMGLADNLVILHNGTIAAQGSPVYLYQNPPSAYVARMLTKSNVLSPKEAGLLGIEEKHVAIHPEWIKLYADPFGDFKIERIIYRGFYEEIIIASDELNLRVYQMAEGKWKAGQLLKIEIIRIALL